MVSALEAATEPQARPAPTAIRRLAAPWDGVAFWLLATAIYAAIAWYYFAKPLATRWGEALLGTSLFPPDPILNAAILEWGLHALRASPLHLLNWPAGFPLTNSLAGTENLIGWQALYAPLRLLGVGNVAAVNSLIVGSIIASALGMALLAGQVGLGRPASLIAGFVFGFVPFHVSQLIQVQSLSVAWAPLALVFLDRLLTRGRGQDVLGLTASIVLTCLSGIYIGLFLLFVMASFVVVSFVTGRHRPDGALLFRLALAVGAAITLLTPLIAGYVSFGLSEGYGHPSSGIVGEALLDFLRPAPWQAVWSRTSLVAGSFVTAAFPGVLAVLLASIGAIRASREGPLKPITRTALVLFVVTVLVCLGPYFKTTDENVLSIGGRAVPAPGAIFLLLSAVRYPMRMLLFGVLFGALLGGLGAHVLLKGKSPFQRYVIAAVLLALMAVEYRPAPSLAAASMSLPPPSAMSPAYAMLAQENDHGAIVELPWIDVGDVGDPTFMALAVYASAAHSRRTVSYYGAVRPAEIDRLQHAAAALPDEGDRLVLEQAGVTRLLVHSAMMNPDRASDLLARLDRAGYTRLFTAPDAVVYSLQSKARSPVVKRAQGGV